MTFRACLALLLLAGCSSGEKAPTSDNSVELPQPSGPPVVQQVENGAEPAAPAETAPSK